MKSYRSPWVSRRAGLAAWAVALAVAPAARGEAMLQYFNTSWKEIAAKMPELAEAGYSSLWIPPPTKGSGGLSVGYDMCDPFDLGGRYQRGTVTTRYGTEAELLNMIETAHRFGIRVYPDNIMNHRAFDVPGYNESTPTDVYPGMAPEDFHVRRTEDGFYRKWDNCRDWNSAWQVMNLGLSDLIDIAHETPNDNFGANEGDDHPKPSFVRHPRNPEFYDRMPNTNKPPEYSNPWDWSAGTDKNVYVGFGTNNGITTNMIADYPAFFSEDVGAYLCRNARWTMATTKADGLRLDAVKHVPDYFFGAFGDDANPAGYCGNAQWQFNMTRGYSDWANHRDSCFNTEIPRDDAVLFGEHLGNTPPYGGYWSAGMRLVDNDLRSQLNNRLGSMWEGLGGYDQPGYGGFSPNTGVMHAQSHDNDYAACKELQHAFYFLREGLGLLYTDGNHHAETLGESGGAFPRWANTAYLGQWGQGQVPNLLYCHEQLGRGYQLGVWSDADYVAWERLDWRQGGSTADAHVTMLVMLNDNYAAGQSRDIVNLTHFPHVSGSGDAYLYNYSWYGGGFYKYASQLWDVTVPPGGYFIFGWKNPDPASTWMGFGGQPLAICENGKPVDTVAVVRQDGPDGDAGCKPCGLADTNSADYSYPIQLPRITNPTNVGFVARVDGSAQNVLMKLDGGMDLNSASHSEGDPRDNPPALANDVFLGYEQAAFVKRIWAEKFAASDSNRCKIGSGGAETYCATIGVAQFTINFSNGSNDFNTYTNESAWIYHDPNGTQDGPRAGYTQFWPAVASAANQTLYIAVKTPKSPGNELWFYYTTNGVAYPEGAGGTPGNPDTRVVSASWVGDGDGSGTTDWWEAQVPALPAGTVLRYKASVFKRQGGANGWYTVWPGNAVEIALKHKMLGEWQVTNVNLATIQYRPHADYGEIRTGLPDGFHIVSARAFLNRNDGAAVYNTFKQTFYLDAETPQGYVQWPESNGVLLAGSEYGVVVRTDPTVREVWYRIVDDDPANDDAATGKANGNGTGFEPYTDANADGEYDAGEPFVDLDGDAVWDATGVVSWQQATATTPDDMNRDYPQAWRFTYANLPTGGTAGIQVRLREWSSAARPAWTNAALTTNTGHYSELVRTASPAGTAYKLYFDWPEADGTLVEAGWEIRVKYASLFASGLDDAGALALFTIKLNSAENGGDPANGAVLSHDAIGISHQWNWPNENTIAFTMPNVYNGHPTWLHGFEIRGVRDGYPPIRATRQVTTRGELLPPLIIAEPQEFTSDGQPYEIILPDLPASALATNPGLRTTNIRLSTDTNAVATGIYFTSPTGFAGALSAGTATNVGSTRYWDYRWSNLTAGSYRFTAWVRDAADKTNTASRCVTIKLLQIVDTTATNDLDHDDDGVVDSEENTVMPLPNGFPSTDGRYNPNSDQWVNRDILIRDECGATMPSSPDGDGDGLPDGLEMGWRWPHADTDTDADTNADGWMNFRPDLDPPFYNTIGNEYDADPKSNYGRVPGVSSASAGGDRTKRLEGTTTDPANPDTDYDGLPDGVEDANRNGWVDGDGTNLPPDYLPWLDRDWPTGQWDELWTETDPNQADSDGDGLSDGYGEDKNFNGGIDGDDDSNRVWSAGEEWIETDPLNPDTDGDGLPDGWETRNGLDPFDSGIVGAPNLNTGLPIASTAHGAAGDPDGDTFSNLVELLNGTNPRVFDDPGQPPPAGAITIGRGAPLGAVNGKTNYVEFSDWKLDDLIALDPYNDGGSQKVDIFRRWDGYDTSRDMVAFYARDGGAGAGKVYFRIDFEDLQANAEAANLDVYVMLDFNSPDAGEAALPDEVDGATAMKWEAAAAVYDSQSGRLYVDTLQNPAHNTLTEADDLYAAGVREIAGGFQGAYFNSELDAVEFSIDRAALVEAGWNGNAATLNFQVFTTKDGTCNTCAAGKAGPGDLGGRIDVTDSIRTDWICSDYWKDYDYIALHGVLTDWIGKNADNNCGQAAKIAMLAHGNQAIQPGSVIHDVVNNGQGAGYHRPILIHGMYQAPLNLHVTPTLAMALEWAAVKTNGPAYRSGPALNAQIRDLVASNVVALLASTYSDHVLPYFSLAFNSNNVALATETLNRIYGAGINSNSVFWPPERVLDAATFAQIAALGFRYSLVDQNTHVWNWYGRTVALGDDGYRINKINGVNCFVINNSANDYRFANHDGGLPVPLRELFSRRARSGNQNQVATVFCMWEEFGALAQADAYDKNLRWLANHPWMQLVRLDDIAAGEVALPWDQTWDPIERGATAGTKQSHDWINHANNENYDNWFYGSPRHEGLAPKIFEVRSGTNLPSGARYGSMTNGILANVWQSVQGLTHPDVKRLARQTLHASVFETAFHQESNNNLSRWSFGGYIYPASEWQGLQGFAWNAQGQTRRAAVYAAVDAWAGAPPAAAEAIALDMDLDGENEYVLRNAAVMALFERIGGRMIGAWLKNGTNVFQMIGNFAAFPDLGTEEEGTANVRAGAVAAYRTSALKDWWTGATNGVNALYAAALGANSLTFSNAGIVKTISLANAATNAFAVAYAMPGALYVRNGFSPDLETLLETGQRYLKETGAGGAALTMAIAPPSVPVGAGVRLAVTTGTINLGATDKSNAWDTVDMRNQAQTRQVEIVGTNALAFSIAFFVAESENQPPEIGFVPPGPYTNAVGTTNAFTVVGTDPDADPVDLASGPLPFTAAFNPATGAFAWWVTNLGSAGTTNRVEFTADDGAFVVTNVATIVVPWDANGNDIPDDWEYQYFDGDLTQPKMGDWDNDRFPNFNEWWASTDPDVPGSYIGWTSLFQAETGMGLTFLALPNRIYHVEGNANDLPTASSWQWLATVTNDADNVGEWIDTNYSAQAVRHYRIKIPAYSP